MAAVWAVEDDIKLRRQLCYVIGMLMDDDGDSGDDKY